MDDDSKHEADDDLGYDPSDVACTKWLGSKIFNYKTMDHYTMKTFIKSINVIFQTTPRGRSLVSSVAYYETYEDYKDNWIYEWNKDVPWVDEKPWTNAGVWTKPTHQLNILASLSTIKLDVRNGQHVDYEWYKALEDSELKDEALRNKTFTEGFIKEDDDKSRYEQKRRWNTYTNYNDA
ncbi:hypothetical protein Tco_1257933 [Tanacetum coccineum]